MCTAAEHDAHVQPSVEFYWFSETTVIVEDKFHLLMPCLKPSNEHSAKFPIQFACLPTRLWPIKSEYSTGIAPHIPWRGCGCIAVFSENSQSIASFR